MGKKKHQKKERNEDQNEQYDEKPAQKSQQTPQQTKQQHFQPIPPKKVSYCPVCSFTFELCKYGKQAIKCAIFLFKLAPTKVNKYHPTFKPEQVQQQKAKKQNNKEQSQQQNQQISKEGKGNKKESSVKQKYIVIEIKNRGKKNFLTIVSGLNNFNVDSKQLAKKCGKKFAALCSPIQLGTIQLQGDQYENMRDFLLQEYKQLKKKFIISMEQFRVKQAQQKQKRKAQRKAKGNVIQQVPQQQQEKVVQEVKDRNTLRMQAMKKADQQQQEDD